MLMTQQHPKWEEFCDRLEGVEGCDFKYDERGEIVWRCNGGMNKDYATAILKTYPDIDIDETLKYFEDNGGHCDCEILFNVKHK